MLTRRLTWAFVIAVLFTALANAPADARQHKKRNIHHYSHSHSMALADSAGRFFDNDGRQTWRGPIKRASDSPMGRRHIAPSNGYDMADNSDPRPGRWCMWWLRRHLGIAKSAFPKWGENIARNGKYIGSPASGPAPGVIVVWNHHVGIITGGSPGHWVVLSGNDGHAVRERERPLHGVIAFRWPHGGMASL